MQEISLKIIAIDKMKKRDEEMEKYLRNPKFRKTESNGNPDLEYIATKIRTEQI